MSEESLPQVQSVYAYQRETTQQTFVGLQDVLKTSSRHVLKTSSTRLQRNNFTSSRRLGRRKIVTLKTS